MAYYNVPGGPSVNWYHSSAAAYAFQYQRYNGVMSDPYTSQMGEIYQRRYAALQQYYSSAWYNVNRGTNTMWSHPYMYRYPQTGAQVASSYPPQSLPVSRQQQLHIQPSYRHQLQLPYLLFHQLYRKTEPMAHLQPKSDTPSPYITEPMVERMHQGEGLDSKVNHPTEEFPMSDTRFPMTRPTEERDDQLEQHPTPNCPLEEILGQMFHKEGSGTSTNLKAEGVPISDCEEVLASLVNENAKQQNKSLWNTEDPLRLVISNEVLEKQSGKFVERLLSQDSQKGNIGDQKRKRSKDTRATSASAAAKELMDGILTQRAFGKAPKQPDLIPEARTAVDLLAEETPRQHHRDPFNDTVTANLSWTVPKDEDLEELIVIDQNLDDILNGLEKSILENAKTKKTASKRNKSEDQKVHTAKRGRQKIQHICDICGKRFSCRASKNVHMRIHSGERPYECSLCYKKFAQRPAWSEHLRIHTGEKPYACSDCPKAFSSYSSWKKHQRLHTGEKPYTCWICQKGFSQSGNLKRHTKTHILSFQKLKRRISSVF